MKVLLLQLDGGKTPNIALMRISAHHKAIDDEVTFRVTDHVSKVPRHFGDQFDRVYASAIFSKSLPIAEEVWRQWPGAYVGGTGIDPPPGSKNIVTMRRNMRGEWTMSQDATSLESIGIFTIDQDYSIYPNFRHSIGFSQRGCRLRCSFCVVPQKEGRVKQVATISDIWRGEAYPRNIVLLDNDFFGQADWKSRIKEIREGGFKVSFNQGINARCLTEEAAEAIASVLYYDDDFKVRRIYTAWDNRADGERLFAGLRALVKYGVKSHHIMVYMLCGYWENETHEDRDYRRRSLRDFGAIPYPMPFVRTPELTGFQRWVVKAYDKPRKNGKLITWERWQANNYRPEGLMEISDGLPPMFENTRDRNGASTGGTAATLPEK